MRLCTVLGALSLDNIPPATVLLLTSAICSSAGVIWDVYADLCLQHMHSAAAWHEEHLKSACNCSTQTSSEKMAQWQFCSPSGKGRAAVMVVKGDRYGSSTGTTCPPLPACLIMDFIRRVLSVEKCIYART